MIFPPSLFSFSFFISGNLSLFTVSDLNTYTAQTQCDDQVGTGDGKKYQVGFSVSDKDHLGRIQEPLLRHQRGQRFDEA